MIERDEIDLLTTAANRGVPRGAAAVWENASTGSEMQRSATKPVSRSVRTVVAASVVALVGVIAVTNVPTSENALVASGADGAASLDARLPEGWSVAEQRGTLVQPAPTQPQLVIYQRDDRLVVASEPAVGRGGAGIIWTIPDDPDARPFPLGDGTATLSNARTNHNELDLLTITLPDGTWMRMASRGVSRTALVDAAATLVQERPSDSDGLLTGRTSLAGLPDMPKVFAGPQASGPLLSGIGVVRVGLRHQSGSTATVMVSSVPFDRAATSWFFSDAEGVDVGPAPGLLTRSDDGSTLQWFHHDLSFLVAGAIPESVLHDIASSVTDVPARLWSNSTSATADEESSPTTSPVKRGG